MIKPVMRIIAVLIMITLAAGCVGRRAASWKPVDTAHRKHPQTAGLPSSWLFYDDKAAARQLVLTRHGPYMDVIRITTGQKLPVQMPYADLSISAGMQTYEIAEVVMNNLRVTPGVFDLLVEELAPAEIDGKEAFRLSLSYSLENGIRRRCLILGTIHGGGKQYTELAMYAHEDYYFDEVIEDFLGMVKKVRVR
ncbi:MAG: hypothetical protein LBC59_07520 [Chitinispirillales bacterium]|jgi:hypothetical protein|nr:hypothetical protein [Chitinispirillales bacterium]